jgi:hypothetical protein
MANHKKELDDYSKSENDDDDNSSVASAIDLSCLNRFKDRTATPSRRSVRFAENTKPAFSYNAIDSTESTTGTEESIKYDRITECSITNKGYNDLAKARICDEESQDEEFSRVIVFRKAFSTARADSYNGSLFQNSCMEIDDTYDLNVSMSSDSGGDEASSDDGSNYRYSCSVFADDEGSDEENDELNDKVCDDSSVNGVAFESTQRRVSVTKSEKGARRLTIVSEQSRRRSAALESNKRRQSKISQQSDTKSENSKRKQSTKFEHRRKSIVSVAKNIFGHGDDDDDEDGMIARRKSRMSMASKAVNRYVVNEEDDEDAVVMRRITRLSMAGMEVDDISTTKSEAADTASLLNEMYLIMCLAVSAMVLICGNYAPNLIIASSLEKTLTQYILLDSH